MYSGRDGGGWGCRDGDKGSNRRKPKATKTEETMVIWLRGAKQLREGEGERRHPRGIGGTKVEEEEEEKKGKGIRGRCRDDRSAC